MIIHTTIGEPNTTDATPAQTARPSAVTPSPAALSGTSADGAASHPTATEDLTAAAAVPQRRPGHLLIASLDVEWTKNYKIKNGNVPFCWSITWLQTSTEPGTPPQSFACTSAYVSAAGQTQDLIDSADLAVGAMLAHADVIIGHQVSSDLAVLRNASARPLECVQALRDRWHARKATPVPPPGTGPRVIDSRYDVDTVVTGTSRRLVDVCTELALNVTQPELARHSMTALHRIWLNEHDPEARERISVLNLRHGLSAAYAAAHAGGYLRLDQPLNVNRVLHDQLAGRFEWLATPTFQQLL
ncbi:hypothetical protein [Actinomadura formosensis]|uniref:hypothetical protein n=1 Tax=Actinomadura formosensis TaxID=60706 RepID=UPI003D8A67F0